MARLVLRLFGGLEATLDSALITAFESAKVRALLAYLAAEASHPQPRERLAALLWPDWPQQSAMSNLRYALADLRKNIGDREAQPPYLLVSRVSLQLNPEADLWVDIGEFEDAIQQSTIGNLQSAISLFRGPFLDGFSLPDSASFEEWLLAKREYFNQQMLKALSRLAEWSLEQREFEQAEGYARRQIELEPWREQAYQQLMRTLSLKGERVQALAQFESLKQALQRELKVEPSVETKRLLEAIREEKIGEVTVITPEAVTAYPTNAHLRILPTGTVTFLFTDIEGSTPLWEQMPAEMQTAVAQHHAILRQAIEANEGQVFQIVGDGFMAAFRFAPQALCAALAAQRALQSAVWGAIGPIRVRMGLHTGPAEFDPKGNAPYAVSHTLNRVARVMSAGHGGQILLSTAVIELLRGQLPTDVSLKDMGEHHLKGLLQPEHIFQVIVPDLPASFPELKSERLPQHNLPLQLSSFIGREKEIAEIKQLLSKTRLLTLAGVGGTGKTRLALAVGGQVLGEFEHGVWLVELAPLTDSTLIPSTAAALFGLRQEAGRPLADFLSDYFHSKRLLLILDNCEHLIQGAAQFADFILHAGPEVKVLVTSRESLGLAGETVYPVPSLAMPEPLHLPPLPSLVEFEAIQLFTERACAVAPAFAVTETNAQAVAQICRRLDGIPLAIELAAARVKVLSAEHIAARLDDRFRLLTGGSRTALPRHQTLHALIDWSYGLLSEPERMLFRRLSVFHGGWQLEAAEAVCPGGELAEIDVLDGLAGLVNKSLVDVQVKGREVQRYAMLETIRQYAQEKLVETGEAVQLRDQHLAYYLDLTERIEPELRGRSQPARLDQLEEELDNLRTALDWALPTNLEAELRLASAVMWFWHIHTRRMEGLGWLGKGLDQAQTPGNPNGTPTSPPVRAKALAAAGFMHSMEMLWELSKAELEESLSIYRDLGSTGKAGVAFTLEWLGGEWTQDNHEYILSLLRQALVLAREVNAPFQIGECLFSMGIYLEFNEPGSLEARQCLEEALAVLSTIGDPDGIATTYRFMGLMSFRADDLEQAKFLFEQSLPLYKQVGNTEAISYINKMLGHVARIQGNFSIAIEHFQNVVDIEQDLGSPACLGDGLAGLGWVARAEGDKEMAKRYWEEALMSYRKKDNSSMVVEILMGLAGLAWEEGNYVSASQKISEASDIGLDSSNPYLASEIFIFKSKLARVSGDEQNAVDFMKKALKSARKLSPGLVAYILFHFAQLIVRQQPELAARLFGWVDKPDAIKLEMLPSLERTSWETALRNLKSILGEQRMFALWAKGQAMTQEQAVEEALAFCRREAGNTTP